MKKIKTILFAICLTLLFCTAVKAESLIGRDMPQNLNGKSYKMCVGNIFAINAYEPIVSTNNNCVLCGYNAGVEEYVVKALRKGTATVTVRMGENAFSFKVTVVKHKLKNGRCKYCGYKNEKRVKSDFKKIKKKYKNGRKWTNANYYKIPYYAWNGRIIPPVADKGEILGGGYGCAAFAYMVSDMIFAKNNINESGLANANYYHHKNLNKVKVGDIIRYCPSNPHNIIVTKVTKKYFEVAEGNYNGKIHWGRKVKKSSLKNQLILITTRYPI